MLHKSHLGEHGELFPADIEGHIPDERDHWKDMKFAHGPNDPDEPGISAEERARRVEYLDTQWWPAVIAHVQEEREKLLASTTHSPAHEWARIAHGQDFAARVGRLTSDGN